MQIPAHFLVPGKIAEAQRFADMYPDLESRFINGRSGIAPNILETHLVSFASEIAGVYMSTIRPTEITHPRNIFISGTNDLCAALNGVIGATLVHYPEATPSQRVDIARNSFSILVNLAIDRSLVHELPPRKKIPRGLTILPKRLKPANHGKARIVINREVKPNKKGRVYDGVACPAFRGNVPAEHRLPYLMWGSVIDIYKHHGQFS